MPQGFVADIRFVLNVVFGGVKVEVVFCWTLISVIAASDPTAKLARFSEMQQIWTNMK